MCGEQLKLIDETEIPQGSPPRVRGTVLRSIILLAFCRITPACAGNSVLRIPLTITNQDHPRVCGEQVVAVALVIWAEGSPPRVRGTG